MCFMFVLMYALFMVLGLFLESGCWLLCYDIVCWVLLFLSYL